MELTGNTSKRLIIVLALFGILCFVYVFTRSSPTTAVPQTTNAKLTIAPSETEHTQPDATADPRIAPDANKDAMPVVVAQDEKTLNSATTVAQTPGQKASHVTQADPDTDLRTSAEHALTCRTDECFYEAILQFHNHSTTYLPHNTLKVCIDAQLQHESAETSTHSLAQYYTYLFECALSDTAVSTCYRSTLDTCYLNLGTQTLHVPACKQIQETKDRDFCLSEIAEDTLSLETCDEITDPEQKTTCLVYVISKTQNAQGATTCDAYLQTPYHEVCEMVHSPAT